MTDEGKPDEQGSLPVEQSSPEISPESLAAYIAETSVVEEEQDDGEN